MKRHSPIILFFLFCLCHLTASSGAAAPPYQRRAVQLPAGVSHGWTWQPGQASSTSGQATLLVPAPQASDNDNSRIISLSSASTRTLDYFKDVIGAVKSDIDGDGTGDVLVWFRGLQSLKYFKVYFGDKSPSAALRTYIDTLTLGIPDTLAAADLNGDGKAEIIAWYPGLNYLMVHWQESSPSATDRFQRYKIIQVPAPTAGGADQTVPVRTMLFGDFNGDGVRDFIFRGNLFLGDGENFVIKRLTGLPPYASVIHAADVDGNGVTELLMIRKTAGRTDVQVGINSVDENGVIRESSLGVYSANIPEPSYVEFMDYNNDGFGDFILGSGGVMTVLAGTGGGRFSAAGADTAVAADASLIPLGPADWGQDGILDWMFLRAQRDSVVIFTPVAARYVDRSLQAGLNRKLAGNAVAVGDYNNDGLPDIYVVNGVGYNSLFKGQPGGKYVDVAEQAGVHINDGISCAWGDYDNDGFQDLFVAGMSNANKLYRNNGNGTFADSSQAVFIADKAQQRATSVSWGDVNRDGWLDLLIANFNGPNWLLINQGGKRFLNRSKELGLTETFSTESAALVDVDNDGWLDIVTLNAEGPIRLLKGSDKGFTDNTASSGFNPEQVPRRLGQSQSWGDFNRDGYPDLYVTRAQDVDALYMNSGKNGLTRFERKFSDHIDNKYGRIASAIADFNEDGMPDLLITRTSIFGEYISNGMDMFFKGTTGYPNLSIRTEPGDDQGLRRTVDTNLPVPADFDGDGDLDILFVNYLPNNSSDLFLSSALPMNYMENVGRFERNLVVRLKRSSNRSAIGARVVLHSGSSAWLQTISGGVGRIQNTGSLVYSLPGPGQADSLIVFWPQGGRQTFRGPLGPGVLEVMEDLSGPSMVSVQTPGEFPLEGEIISTTARIHISLEIRDPSGVSWVRTIIWSLSEANPNSLYADTLYAGPPTGDIYRVERRSPAPGDSLYYRIEAMDRFGNLSSLPYSGEYMLKNNATRLDGDIDSNNKVDIFDFLRLLQLMGSDPSASAAAAAADIDANGKIDSFDMLLLLKLM